MFLGHFIVDKESCLDLAPKPCVYKANTLVANELRGYGNWSPGPALKKKHYGIEVVVHFSSPARFGGLEKWCLVCLNEH